MKSDMGRPGIQVTLVPQSFNTIIGESAPCKPTDAGCKWDSPQLRWLELQRTWLRADRRAAVRDRRGSNSGSYSDATMDKLINLTHTSSSLSVFQQYATYLPQQLPFIWTPNALQRLGVKQQDRERAASTRSRHVLPEYWNFTK